MFHPLYKYFKKIANSNYITLWKSKGLSDKSTKPPATSNNSIDLALNYILNYINTKLQVKFDGSCLKQGRVTFTHKKVINIYIIYEISLWSYTQSANFTLGNYLFGAVEWTINADSD